MSPMQIRLLKVCTKEEIEKCFGLIVNKNEHQYINCLDPKLITKVERRWMIVHQKPYVLASRIIILGMARGIMCEHKGKQLNYATYDEWTSVEQLQHAKSKGGVGDNRFEDMFDEDEHFDEEPNADMPKVSEQGLPSTTL